LKKKTFVRFLIVLGLAESAILAQKTDVAAMQSRMIVVVKPEAKLDSYARLYATDSRLETKMNALARDRAVAGLVQLLEKSHAFQASRVYTRSIRGFAASLTPNQIKILENNPLIQRIEPDAKFSLSSQSLPWGVNKIDADRSSVAAGKQTFGNVAGVDVYVIDTGVDVGNPDLNIAEQVNFVADDPNTDCNGHGTHVAGTIGAIDNALDVVGVAPGVPIHGVKVLSCWGFGYLSDILAGVDWVTRTAARPAVANLSLTGPATQSLDDAVQASADSGVFYAVAAGNYGSDACWFSPARLGGHTNNGVMTVAATDTRDREAYFSNYGSCVDTWAPGYNVPSLLLGGGTVIMSGTSMSAPHVAGTAALYLRQNPSATPADVEAQLKYNQVTPGTKSRDGRIITRIYAGNY
jgi:aqualysin 1